MLSTIIWYLVLLIGVLFVVYTCYMSRNHRQLKKLGITGPTPWPIVGTLMREVNMGMFQYHRAAYQKYKQEKVYGSYWGKLPIIFVKDLDMIREICVKQFSHFTNRRTFTIEETIDQSVSNLKDERWKMVRSIVSPTFSSGKLKRMGPLVQKVAKQLVAYLKEKQERNEEVELKDAFSRYTMDVVASTGFGADINSFYGEDSKFALEAKKMITGINFAGFIGLLGDYLWPVIKHTSNLGPGDSLKFFSTFVDKAMEVRRSQQMDGSRSGGQDFLQLLIEAQEEEGEMGNDASEYSSSTKNLTHLELLGQALIFFFAGYDTTSSVMSHSLFQLAMNQECLAKVHEEIDEQLGDEPPNYDNVQKLAYLDMCLNETMRMYPPGFVIDRICNEEIEIQGVKFPKDIGVCFCVCGIHYDPEIWPEPDAFKPERFIPEEKANRHPYAHMPFGQGPRNCVGMRLALLTLKIGVASTLQILTPVRCDKSVYPVKIKTINIDAQDGLWVRMEERKSNSCHSLK